MQLSVRDAGRLLHVSDKTVYRWVQNGKLPHYRINGQYRFNRVELLEWATANRVSVSTELLQEPESKDLPEMKLSDALQNGGIFYRISGDDKASVLRQIVETVRLPDEVDREFLLEVLLAREDLGSTGIGQGIAIPHVRNPIILHVHKPSVSLCFLEKPIDFQAIDGQPVGILFTVISPTVRAHLQLLAKLAYALRDEKLLDMLHRQSNREEILQEVRHIEDTLSRTTAAAADRGHNR